MRWVSEISMMSTSFCGKNKWSSYLFEASPCAFHKTLLICEDAKEQFKQLICFITICITVVIVWLICCIILITLYIYSILSCLLQSIPVDLGVVSLFWVTVAYIIPDCKWAAKPGRGMDFRFVVCLKFSVEDFVLVVWRFYMPCKQGVLKNFQYFHKVFTLFLFLPQPCELIGCSITLHNVNTLCVAQYLWVATSLAAIAL